MYGLLHIVMQYWVTWFSVLQQVLIMIIFAQKCDVKSVKNIIQSPICVSISLLLVYHCI